MLTITVDTRVENDGALGVATETYKDGACTPNKLREWVEYKIKAPECLKNVKFVSLKYSYKNTFSRAAEKL